jgi:myo-inositol-1(or 4)-monophosphatase
MSVASYRELAVFGVDVARRAGEAIARLRERGFDVTTKAGGRELVTSADLASNEIIQEATARATPEAQYLSEEGSRRAALAPVEPIDWARPVWVVDPIDGTANYVYGQSHVAVSIAYVVGGEVQVGVVHAPFQGEIFVAVRGEGATCNGARLPRAEARKLEDAIIATGFPNADRSDLEAILARLARVVRRCRDVRRLASPAIDLCWVAAGRLDAAYETLRPWDVAAAGLVAREAGVARGSYRRSDSMSLSDVPIEVCGRDVVHARPGLLEELLTVLCA